MFARSTASISPLCDEPTGALDSQILVLEVSACRRCTRRRLGRLLAGTNGMTEPSVDRFMTRGPHTIGHDQTLGAAHHVMNEHAIRHLPVLHAGKLVGVLSLRDLHFIETLEDFDQVQVSEAMSQDVFAIGPRSSVRKVAAEMAEHKYGCAVVIDAGRVVGIFTTVDALRALSSLLDEQRRMQGRRDVQ